MATVIAVLYSLWLPEIKTAMDSEWKPLRPDRLIAIAPVRTAFWTKAVPLVVVSGLPAVVFMPEVAKVLGDTLSALVIPGTRASYDSVRAAFFGVYLLTLILVAVSVGQAVTVWRWLRKWDGRP